MGSHLQKKSLVLEAPIKPNLVSLYPQNEVKLMYDLCINDIKGTTRYVDKTLTWDTGKPRVSGKYSPKPFDNSFS